MRLFKPFPWQSPRSPIPPRWRSAWADSARDKGLRQQISNAHERSHTREGKWIKGTRWSLPKAPEKQTLDPLALLGEAQQANKPPYRRLPAHRGTPRPLPDRGPQPRARAPRRLARVASRSRLEPFVKLARTIRRYRDRTLAAIPLGLNNGRLEGLNSRIRLGDGWRYVCCGLARGTVGTAASDSTPPAPSSPSSTAAAPASSSPSTGHDFTTQRTGAP
jgi:hypothetical protein